MTTPAFTVMLCVRAHVRACVRTYVPVALKGRAASWHSRVRAPQTKTHPPDPKHPQNANSSPHPIYSIPKEIKKNVSKNHTTPDLLKYISV